MAATKQLLLCLAGLMMLGVSLASSGGDIHVLTPFLPPVSVEDTVDKPDLGSWNYTDGTITCILSKFALRMTFEHNDFTGGRVDIDLPVTGTSMDGSECDSGDPLDPSNEVLSITFFDDDFNLKFIFAYDLDLDEGDREWYIKEITLEYLLSAKYFPGYTGNDTDSVTFDAFESQDMNDEDLFFKADLAQSFRCNGQLDQGVVKSPAGVNVSISTWDFVIEAYRTRNDTKMSFPERCLLDQERDKLVPGIIGGFLLATVVAVLIVYVFMRKQRDRGYQANADEDAAKAAEASS